MAYVITDTCVSCGSCASECPVGAISEGDCYLPHRRDRGLIALRYILNPLPFAGGDFLHPFIFMPVRP